MQVLAEVRVRLVAGLKRYFHEKRGQGLLTGPGILVLDHACDAAMDSSAHPLIIWKLVERCVHIMHWIQCDKASTHCLYCLP